VTAEPITIPLILPVAGTRPAASAASAPDRATGARPRLLGVDATRGVALLGMMAVHALSDTTDTGAPTLMYMIFGGRSAATFAVLAGVGIALMTGRARVRPGPDGRAAAATLLARALVIVVIGLALGYTDAGIGAVILPYYAVMFLLAIPVVFLPTWVLATFAALIAGGMPVLGQWLRPTLVAPVLDNPSILDLLQNPLRFLTELTLTGYYPALPWMAYVCAGIVVGRLRLSSARTAAGLLGTGVVLAVAATAASWWLLGPLGGLNHIQAATPPAELATAPTVADYVAIYSEGTTPTTTWWWLAVDAPHSSAPLDLIQTIGSAVGLLGAMLLLGHITRPATSRIIGAVNGPLAAAGSMTLTLYTAHIVYMNSPLDDFDSLPGYLIQVTVALLFAIGWRQAVGRGPFEAIVTSITHRARDKGHRARR
jgi:uncharacterized membrane protein